MGLFLMLAGVANSNRSAVEEALREFVTARRGKMDPIAIPGASSKNLLVADSGGHVIVIYPDDFLKWDEASEFLSQRLDTSVFSFHIHDGDLWMYVLFSKGVKIDQFNPIPAYWDDSIAEEERLSWAGNAELVCQHWPGVIPDSIKKYLTEWDLTAEDSINAYQNDRFAYGDCWQLTDYMQRLGLVYPIDDNGTAHGDCFRLKIPC